MGNESPMVEEAIPCPMDFAVAKGSIFCFAIFASFSEQCRRCNFFQVSCKDNIFREWVLHGVVLFRGGGN